MIVRHDECLPSLTNYSRCTQSSSARSCRIEDLGGALVLPSAQNEIGIIHTRTIKIFQIQDCCCYYIDIERMAMEVNDDYSSSTAWLPTMNNDDNQGWSSSDDTSSFHRYLDESGTSDDSASSSGASTHDTSDDTHDHSDDWRVSFVSSNIFIELPLVPVLRYCGVQAHVFYSPQTICTKC